MKKRKILLSFAALLGAATVLVACDDNTQPSDDNVVKYNIIFKNGDDVLSSEEVKEGDFFAVPAIPQAADGYMFIGWDANNDGTADSIGAAAADATYSAIFAPIPVGTHTVTFKNGDEIVGVVLYDEDDTSVVEPAVPAKLGYSGSWASYELNGSDIEVEAIYTLEQYMVSFYADGALISQVPYSVENYNITAPVVPAKEGYSGSWEAYNLANSTGDVRVDAVYVANPLTINDFLGIYNNGEEVVTITPDKVLLHYYNDIYEDYRDQTYVTEAVHNDPNSVNADYYFKVEGNSLNLYDYNDIIQKSYILVDGQLVAQTVKVSVSTWGTYEYKVDGNVVSSLVIDEDGITYTNGNSVYATSYAVADDGIVVVAGDSNLEFSLNSKNNYELSVTSDEQTTVQEFVKVVDTSWYGTYYYAKAYPNQVVLNDSVLDQIKLIKGGFEFSGVSFIVTENGTLNFLDYNGNIKMEEEYENGQVVSSKPAEYVKLQIATLPESLYGTYRSSYGSELIISADGVTIYDALAKVVEYSYGTDAEGNKIEFINIDGQSASISASGIQVGYTTYYKSYAGDIDSLSKVLPASFEALKGKVFEDADGNLFKIDADGNINYGLSDYDGSSYYFFVDNELHLFKSQAYALTDELIFSVVDGKLMCGEEELVEFNIALEDIVGTYLNGDSKIVVSADGINYLGTNYALSDITVQVYNISFGDVTLVYDPDSYSLVVNDLSYLYSPTLSHNIPSSLYGSYNAGSESLLIDETGIYFIANSEKTYALISSYEANTLVLEYEEWGSLVTRTLTINDDGSLTDDWGNSFVELPEQIINDAWIGYYSAEVEDFWGTTVYELDITSDSISFNDGMSSSSSYIILSDTKFRVGDYEFTYDAATQSFSLSYYGSDMATLNKGDKPSVEEPSEDAALDPMLYGSWSGSDWAGTYTLEITESDVSFFDAFSQSYSTSFTVVSSYEITVTAEAFGGSYTLTYDPVNDIISANMLGNIVTLTHGGR